MLVRHVQPSAALHHHHKHPQPSPGPYRFPHHFSTTPSGMLIGPLQPSSAPYNTHGLSTFSSALHNAHHVPEMFMGRPQRLLNSDDMLNIHRRPSLTDNSL